MFHSFLVDMFYLEIKWITQFDNAFNPTASHAEETDYYIKKVNDSFLNPTARLTEEIDYWI